MKLSIALAPMEGVTNFPLRAWFWLASTPDALATPFLRVTATYPHLELPRTFAPELGELAGAVPYSVVPQLMAVETDEFLRAAEMLLPKTPFIDLNCGCPSPTCVGKGAGSSMLRDPDEFHADAAKLAAALGPGRLGIKMRTGFHSAAEFPRLLAGLAPLPLARLTVHGRTRPDGYTGQARWDLIEAAARATSAPVIASGDVTDRESLYARLATAPSVQGVIVGRGALRNPWVFLELRQGEAVTLSLGALLHALAAFGVLHELYAEHFDTLVALVKDGLLARPCLTDEGAWEKLYQRLSEALYGEAVPLGHADLAGRLPLSRHSMGRVKLVWNYLRSSLPPPFFAPLLMRSSDLGSLLAGIRGLHAATGSPESLPLVYAAEHDWMYSGRKSEAAPAPAAAAVAASGREAAPRLSP